MDEALPEALVSGYEQLIDSIVLPDPADRHIVAASVQPGAMIVVTQKLADFQNGVLGHFNLEAQNPDNFIIASLDIFAHLISKAAKNHHASLQDAARTTDE